MQIRPWMVGDEARIDGLLDDVPDPLWVMQMHAMHGPNRESPRWRRTRVAVLDEEIVGAVSIGVNQVHGGRLNGALEVSPSHRRQGIGRVLLAAGRDLRESDLPIMSKVRPDNAAAADFLDSVGGSLVQQCRGERVDPADPRVRDWCTAPIPVADIRVTSLEGVAPSMAASAYAEMYRWVHESWSPVTSEGALRDMSEVMAGELVPELSAGAWRGQDLLALVCAFAEPDGANLLVAETARRSQRDGAAVLALAIAHAMTEAGRAKVRYVEFDGHVDDPHLSEVLESLPQCGSNPLLLVSVA